MVEAGTVQFVVADVPGLIPGASEGKGLGLSFLRHVERCSTLVHVLDCATYESDRDPLSDLDAIEAELAAYGAATDVDLSDRPRIVALNKVDVPDGRDLADMVAPLLRERGFRVIEVSAVAREGLRELSFAMAEQVEAARAARPAAEPSRVVLRPRELGGAPFEVVPLGDNTFRVRGDKPARWVRQTDFANEEAVGYLADRLNRLGIESALAKAGATEGAEVYIGDEDDSVVFDWDPSIDAEATRSARAAPTPGWASRAGAVGSQPPTTPRKREATCAKHCQDRRRKKGRTPPTAGPSWPGRGGSSSRWGRPR